MKRIAVLVAAAVFGVVALQMPAPPEPEIPEFTPIDLVDVGAAQGAVWYCPWLSAGAVRDSWLSVASLETTEIAVTLPSPIPNEEPDISTQTLTGPNSVSIEVASIVRRGTAPGFVELSAGPSAVSAVVSGEELDAGGAFITGDRCTASVPKLWHLPGATTKVGQNSNIRLFNPFPEPAKVAVAGTSEFGDAGLLGLSSVDVPGRTWIDIDLNELSPFLDDLSLTVSSEEGLVIPSLVVTTGTDEASWPGTGLSTAWEFPVVSAGGLTPFVVIANPGDSSVTVDIDVHTNAGQEEAATTVVVEPGTPLRVPLADLSELPFAIAVRATAPVAAVVIAEDVVVETVGDEEEQPAEPALRRIAGTVGADQPALQWLVAGPGAVSGSTSTIWVLNTGSDTVTASIQRLGGTGAPIDELSIKPGAMERIVVPSNARITGYLVDATGPVTAAWSLELDDAVALLAAVPIVR